MRSASQFAFAALEDFSVEPEDQQERFQRELESRVAEALEHGYQRGFEAGRHQSESAADAKILALEASFAQEMSSSHIDWQTGTGNLLAEQVTVGIAKIHATLEDQLAILLKPLVKDALYRQALQQFHSAMDRVVENGVAIEIRGSSDLVRGAEQRIPESAKYVSVVHDGSPTIHVKCDDTIVSAEFGAWLALLEEPAL